MSGFPTQIFILADEDGDFRNLVYMANTGELWVREGKKWEDFIIDESNPKRQFEDMEVISVSPQFVDIFDAKNGKVDVSDADEYRYIYVPDPNYMEIDKDSENLEI